MADVTRSTDDLQDHPPFVEPGVVVHRIHKELLDAQRLREEEGLLPLFDVESLEIEMKVGLSLVRQQGGKVDLKLVAITGDNKFDESHTHTIRLKLRAVDDREVPRPSRRSPGIRPSARRAPEKRSP